MKHKLSINRLILACASLLLASVLFGCTSSNDFEKGKEQLEQQEWKKAVSFPLTVAHNKRINEYFNLN